MSGLKRRNAANGAGDLPLFRADSSDHAISRRKGARYNVKGTVSVILVILCVMCGYSWWWIESDSATPDQQHHHLVPNIHQPDLPILHHHYPYTKEWYTPRILPPKFVPVEAWDKGPAIHIVHTRFMQEQGNLTELGHARLGLFRVFCLPSLMYQTTENFLWIIKTDPGLDAEIMQKLVDWLAPFPHFYLVGSNVNFRINEDFPGGWRDGAQAQDLALSKVYTGNQTVLEHAMALELELPVLETRLDADDGLHTEYLEQVQKQAMEEVFVSKDVKWMYWCTRRNLDWHWVDQAPFDNELGKMISKFGAIEMIQHQNLCVTPGITTGFPVGTAESTVPVYGHQELVSELRKLPVNNNCGLSESKECIRFVEKHPFEAVRSRSATSAGMLKVDLADGILVRTHDLSFALWDILYKSFMVQRNQVRWMNEYLTDHVLGIARDNLLGQCTLGHSCKDSARKHLEDIIKFYENRAVTR